MTPDRGSPALRRRPASIFQHVAEARVETDRRLLERRDGIASVEVDDKRFRGAHGLVESP